MKEKVATKLCSLLYTFGFAQFQNVSKACGAQFIRSGYVNVHKISLYDYSRISSIVRCFFRRAIKIVIPIKVRLLFPILLLFFHLGVTPQQFTNVADSMNLFHTLSSQDNWGSGVNFFDFNKDGWDDIVLTQEHDSLTVLMNNQGVFESIAFPIYVNGQNKQFLWVDYDNDGDYDAIISTRYGTFRLYENQGDTSFIDVTTSAGLMNTYASNYGVSFGDYNRDGWLDLYVCRYNGSGDPQNPAHVNALYRNNGDGTFTDVTFFAGVSDGMKPSFHAVWIDFNKDGWPDLYVINDRDAFDNSLYHNNGDGTFTNVAEEANALFAGNDPMTISVADFNNNSWLDIFMTNNGFSSTDGNQMLASLLENNGDGTFTEVAENYGVAFDKFSWGATWIDYDNDSFQDLYICTGRNNAIFPLHSNYFYQNQSAEIFTDSTNVFLGNHVYSSFAVAKGDINNNGFADLVVQNTEGANFLLWQNSGNQNNYVKITLEGLVSNKMAIGSWIYVFIGENTYTHYTLCGENYLSQNSQHHIFGIADAAIVDSIQVEYNSGHIDTYFNLATNQHYYFTEGETNSVSIEHPEKMALCPGESVTLDAGAHNSYLWNTGDTSQTITVSQPGIYHAEAWNVFGLSALSDTVEVVVIPEAEVQFTVQHVSCAGAQDGSVAVQVSTGPVQEITWNTGGTDTLIQQLGSGIYSFTALDSAGCVVSGEVSLFEPSPLLAQAMTTNVLCFGDSTGTAQINVIGGTPPYSTEWNGENPQSLIAGNYNAVVTDYNGCEFPLSYTINQSDSIWVDFTIVHATTNNNGEVSAWVQGGTAPFNLLWSTGDSDIPQIGDLVPGEYSLQVTDANGCLHVADFTIDQVSGIDANFSHGLRVFPNPSGEDVVLEGCLPEADLELYDMFGRRVFSQRAETCPVILHLSHLPAGQYVLRVQHGFHAASLRLVLCN